LRVLHLPVNLLKRPGPCQTRSRLQHPISSTSIARPFIAAVVAPDTSLMNSRARKAL
jgi:hypothetical protein